MIVNIIAASRYLFIDEEVYTVISPIQLIRWGLDGYIPQ